MHAALNPYRPVWTIKAIINAKNRRECRSLTRFSVSCSSSRARARGEGRQRGCTRAGSFPESLAFMAAADKNARGAGHFVNFEFKDDVRPTPASLLTAALLSAWGAGGGTGGMGAGGGTS